MVNSNGGFIHPNVRIGLDPMGQYRGVFVKNAGAEGGHERGDQGRRHYSEDSLVSFVLVDWLWLVRNWASESTR